MQKSHFYNVSENCILSDMYMLVKDNSTNFRINIDSFNKIFNIETGRYDVPL